MDSTRSRFAWLLLCVTVVGLLAAVWPWDARRVGLAANTARLAAATCAFSVPVGTLLAVLLSRTDLPCRRVLALLLAWLVFVPLYVQVGAWEAGFGIQGWQTLAGWGHSWLSGMRGAIWVHTVAAVPWVTWIVSFGLRTISPELEEQALLDGRPLQVLARVTLPLAAPLIAAAALLAAVSAAGEIAVTDQFQVRTYAEELYTQTALGAPADRVTVDLLPGMLLTGWMIAAALLLVVRIAPQDRQPIVRSPVVFALGAWRWPAFALVLLCFALLVGLPLGNLAWKAGVVVEQTSTGRVRHWSLLKAGAILVGSISRYRREIGHSLVVGSIAATSAVVLAALLAWRARGSSFFSGLLVFAIALALAVPAPVVGLALIKLLNQPDWPWAALYDSIAPPIVAQLIRGLPVAALILWYAFYTIPADQTDLAEVDGAGRWAVLARVALPQRWGALAAAWLAALAIAVGDMAASILVTPPGVELLSIRISGLLHFGVEDQVAGICLLLAIAYLIAGLALLAVLRPKPRSRVTPGR